jgi:CHAT domain-containing protein
VREAFDLLQRVKARALEDRAGPGAAPRPVTAAALQRDVLREGELALDVYPAPDSLLVFAITRRTLRVHVIRDVPSVHARIARFAQLVHEQDAQARSLRDTVAAGVSSTLLGPVRDLLVSARRLIVCGGGVADDLPWALLPEPGTSRRLVQRLELASVPSLTTLARLRQGPQVAATRGPLVLAGALGPGGQRLAGVDDEARWLSRRYATSGVHAPRTRTQLRTALAALPGADAIHVAAHFADDPQNPWRAGILLGDPNHDDAWIRPASLASVHLRARLVVLAGCASASGHRFGLSAERGVASAFLASGARSVVGTLWPVEDGASAEFAHRFYRALDDGQTVGGAVARAQEGMRGSLRWSSPEAWAGFVVLGDPAVRLTLERRTNGLLPAMLGGPGVLR